MHWTTSKEKDANTTVRFQLPVGFLPATQHTEHLVPSTVSVPPIPRIDITSSDLILRQLNLVITGVGSTHSERVHFPVRFHASQLTCAAAAEAAWRYSPGSFKVI